ncbi:MAG: hypothetical protein ABH828_06190 [archaeon]
MKRKVIQHSPTSLVITLPSKWAKTNSIVKGDEIELLERNNELSIKVGEAKKEFKEINLDISGLDKTTIINMLKNLYRRGYDKINISYNNEKIPYMKQEFLVTDIIHEEMERLLGYEIVREQKNSCIVANISEGISEEIPVIIRRIYLLLIDMAETMLEGAKTNDLNLIKSVKNKHNTVIRFISYCLRSAVKGTAEPPINQMEFHRIATMDRIVHLLRSSAKRMLLMENLNSKSLHRVLQETVDSLRLFHKEIYTNNSVLVSEMNKNRYEIDEVMDKDPKCLIGPRGVVMFQLRQIHHLLLDVVDVREK